MLASYDSASSSDSDVDTGSPDSDIEEQHPAPLKKARESGEPLVLLAVGPPTAPRTKLPSALDLLSDSGPSFSTIAVPQAGYTHGLPPGSALAAATSAEAPKPKVTSLVPPQMRRPNVSTEDVRCAQKCMVELLNFQTTKVFACSFGTCCCSAWNTAQTAAKALADRAEEEKKKKALSFNQKEKRKRDLGQSSRAKNFVEGVCVCVGACHGVCPAARACVCWAVLPHRLCRRAYN